MALILFHPRSPKVEFMTLYESRFWLYLLVLFRFGRDISTVGPYIQKPFKIALEKQKEKLHRKPGPGTSTSVSKPCRALTQLRGRCKKWREWEGKTRKGEVAGAPFPLSPIPSRLPLFLLTSAL